MTGDEQTAGSERRFPLLALVRASYNFVFEYKTLLPFVLLQPALIYLGFSLLLDIGGFETSGEESFGRDLQGHVSFSVNGVALMLVLFAPASLLFVAWHRVILLAGAGGPPRWFYAPRKRHWKYFGYMSAGLFAGMFSLVFSAIAATVIMAFLASLAGFLALILYYLFMATLPAAYVILFVRFSFIFPAIAVDEALGLSDAWYQTTSITWPLSVGFLLCFLPGILLLLAMNVTFFDVIKGSGGVPIWLEAANLFVLSYSSLVAATFISFSFQSATGWLAPHQRNSAQDQN